MTKIPHVLTVGYPSLDWIYLIDRIPEVEQTARILNRPAHPAPGGCAANIAVACVRLGLRAGVVTVIGADSLGRTYVGALKAAGVDTRGITIAPGERSPHCLLLIDQEGHHLTFYDPGFSERKRLSFRIPGHWERGIKMGVITVGPPALIRKAATWFQRHRIPMLWSLKGDPKAWPDSMLNWLAQHSQLIIMNDMEAIWLQEALQVRSWDALLAGSVRAIAITMGSHGSRVLDHQGWKLIPAVPPRRLVDPTGAGDAFTAGFLWGWVHGLPPERCARVGAVVASFALEAWGAQQGLPTLFQVKDRYHRFFREPLHMPVMGDPK